MGAVFVKILNMSLTAGWIVLAVLLVRFLLKKKAPKALFPILWALVAVRLVCPFSFESSFSLIRNPEPVEQTELPDDFFSRAEQPEEKSSQEKTSQEMEVPGTNVEKTPISMEGMSSTDIVEALPGENKGFAETKPDETSPGSESKPVAGGPEPVELPEELPPGVEYVEFETPEMRPSASGDEEGIGTVEKTPVSVTYNEVGENGSNFSVKRTDLFAIAAIIWLSGIGIMLLYTAISYIWIYRRVKESAPLTDKVRICDRIDSPFVLGIIKPRIYLPSDINITDREYVLAHEKAHLKRFDHIWKPLGFLLLSVYWFHPLLWVAYILLCKDIEYACDEKVIKEWGAEQKKTYSTALINCSVSRKMISACPLAFGENGVKGRVKSVLHYKKPAFWVLIASVLVCVVMAVCFLTNPKGKEETPEVTPTPEVTDDTENTPGAEISSSGVKAGDIISFGSYEQDNVFDNGKEPIEWLVLDVFDGKATLLSKYGLDAKPYHTTKEAVTWETSAIRSWLNTEFYEAAFTEKEMKQILDTKLENPNNPLYGTVGGANTTDKIYLLSAEEVVETFKTEDNGYLSVYYDYFSKGCITGATAYAKEQGAWEVKDGETVGCGWLLRTPGEEADRVSRVTAGGNLDYCAEADYGSMSIRPAIRVELSGADYKVIQEAEYPTDGTYMTRSARWKDVVPLSEAKAGYLVEFGSYEQDNRTGNGAEAIEWYVLEVKNGKALLLSRYILAELPYHERRENVTWEDCTLRKWLNEEFYRTAFTEEEKRRVIPTLLENVRNPWNLNAGYEYTEDKVFLPAIEDVLYGEYSSDINYPEELTYSFDGYFLTDTERKAKITAYGRNKETAGNAFYWWLRGNSHLSFIPSLLPVQEECYRTSWISSDGKFADNGMVEEKSGVRPAIWVEIDDTLSGNTSIENSPNPGTASGTEDGATLAECLPERYSYEEVKRVFLAFINHQAYLYPSEYPQEAYTCTYEVYVTTESKMKRVYLKTVLKGEDVWFLCNPDVYLEEASPITVRRMSSETMRYMLTDKAVTYLGSDTIQIPAVTKPEYHKGSDTDMTQYKTSIELIYDILSENGFRQKSGYEDYLKLEVWISEFDMEKKLYPHAYVIINGSMVYETVFDDYKGLYQRFTEDNYTKQDPVEDQYGELLYTREVFDGRSIKPVSSLDEAQFDRVKECASLHYVYQKEFTKTIEIDGETVTVPEKNLAINDEYQVGIAFVPQYTFSHVTHYNIYRSEDGGKSWFLIAEDYTETAGAIASILIPTRKHIVCYFALNGVTVQSHCILSEDGGATWSSPLQASKPNSSITDPQIGSSVVFGTYEQDGDYSNGNEPLEWIVLDRVKDKALLLTKYTLVDYSYYDKYSSEAWRGSEIRRWLHEYFYVEAFSKEERDCIIKTTNENPDNAYTEVDGGETTEDYVFLLSMDEVLFGKSSDGKPYFRDDAFRVTVPTAEAVGRNILYPSIYGYVWLEKEDGTTPEERWRGVNNEWWLRTPGGTEWRAATVTKEGSLSVPGEDGTLYNVVGTRPAIWVDVTKIPQ